MAALPAGASKLQVGRIENGFILRVQGRGTMRESRVAHEFAMRCLPDATSQMMIDLSGCDYLDSTFQGCLLDLPSEAFRAGRRTCTDCEIGARLARRAASRLAA